MGKQIRGRQRGFRRDAIPLAAVERPGPAPPAAQPRDRPAGVDRPAPPGRQRTGPGRGGRGAGTGRGAAEEIAVIDEALHRRQRDTAAGGFFEDE